MTTFNNELISDLSTLNTNGNGGRKIVTLSNGWIVVVAKAVGYFHFFVKKSKTSGFVPLCHFYGASIASNDIAMVSKDNHIYTISGYGTNAIHFHGFDATKVKNVNVFMNTDIFKSIEDYSQTYIGNVTLYINDDKTELHAAWDSRNQTYNTSINIRYSKGEIIDNNNIFWNVIEQVTNINYSGRNCLNPSIMDINGVTSIVFETTRFKWDDNGSVNEGHPISGWYYYSISLARRISKNAKFTNVHDLWRISTVYMSTTPLSAPTAVFVPGKLINTTNGRVWVAWHTNWNDEGDKLLSTHSNNEGDTFNPASISNLTGVEYIRHPSASLSSNGDVFIAYTRKASADLTTTSGYTKIVGTTRSSFSISGSLGSEQPSSLLDSSLELASPVFVRKMNDGIYISGGWPDVEINPSPSNIELTSNVLLNYTISNTGAMTPVTEKLNGKIINTRTVSRDVEQTIALTQEQLDSIAYGPYTKDIETNMIVGSRLSFEQGSFSDVIGSQYNTEHNTNFVRRRDAIDIVPSARYVLNFNNPNSYYVVTFAVLDENNIILQTFKSEIGSTNMSFKASQYAKKIYLKVENIEGAMSTLEITSLGMSLKQFENSNQPNILEISMGNNVWKYNINRTLNSNSSLIDIVEATGDLNNTVINYIKNNMALELNDNSLNVHSQWEEIIQYIKEFKKNNKKYKRGIVSSSSILTVTPEYLTIGTVISKPFVEVNLDFKPTRIKVYPVDRPIGLTIVTEYIYNFYTNAATEEQVFLVPAHYNYQSCNPVYGFKANKFGVYVNENGFKLPVDKAGIGYEWEAFE